MCKLRIKSRPPNGVVGSLATAFGTWKCCSSVQKTSNASKPSKMQYKYEYMKQKCVYIYTRIHVYVKRNFIHIVLKCVYDIIYAYLACRWLANPRIISMWPAKETLAGSVLMGETCAFSSREALGLHTYFWGDLFNQIAYCLAIAWASICIYIYTYYNVSVLITSWLMCIHMQQRKLNKCSMYVCMYVCMYVHYIYIHAWPTNPGFYNVLYHQT